MKSYKSLVKNQSNRESSSKNNNKIRDIADQLLYHSHSKAKISTSILGSYQNFPQLKSTAKNSQFTRGKMVISHTNKQFFFNKQSMQSEILPDQIAIVNKGKGYMKKNLSVSNEQKKKKNNNSAEDISLNEKLSKFIARSQAKNKNIARLRTIQSQKALLQSIVNKEGEDNSLKPIQEKQHKIQKSKNHASKGRLTLRIKQLKSEKQLSSSEGVSRCPRCNREVSTASLSSRRNMLQSRRLHTREKNTDREKTDEQKAEPVEQAIDLQYITQVNMGNAPMRLKSSSTSIKHLNKVYTLVDPIRFNEDNNDEQ